MNQKAKQTFRLSSWIFEPIGRPNTVDLSFPPQGLKDFLPQPIAIPSRARAVVCCTITLDSRQELTSLIRMSYGDVDVKASNTELGYDFITCQSNNFADRYLKIVFRLDIKNRRTLNYSCLCKG